jgi:ATP-binding cassette, subfamily B (MDR/TAP), member 1
VDVENVLKEQEEEEEELEELNEKSALPAHLKHKSIALRPLSLGNWMFDVVADLTSTKPAVAPSPVIETPSPEATDNEPSPPSFGLSCVRST